MTGLQVPASKAETQHDLCGGQMPRQFWQCTLAILCGWPSQDKP